MKRDIDNYTKKKPSSVQSGIGQGIHKGIVVDVKDPYRLGRVRVWVYALHGDKRKLEVDSLPWCTMVQPFRGAFAAAELNDRVVVSFEAGNKYVPIVLGFWQACPMGRGNAPYSKKIGTDVRPEGWHNRGLYPEAIVISMSGAGNGIWTEDKMIGDTLASVIQMEDTGGKIIRARSFHLGCKPFSSMEEYSEREGGLLEGGDENKPLRNGVTKATPVAGEIELSNQNIRRIMLTSAGKFSSDTMTQADPDGKIGIEQTAISGRIHTTRQGFGSVTLAGDTVSLKGRAVVAHNFMTPPDLW
jgi:hypothetical protein